MAKKVLLVIDCQNDFCPGGNLAVNDGTKIIPTINKLINSGKFDMIVATQDWHPVDHISFADNHGKDPFTTIEVSYGTQMLWPRHCVQGTKGAEFHPDLDTNNIQFIIRKGMNKDVDSYSAFLENDKKTYTQLGRFIFPAADIFVVGIATDVCVFNTAMDALSSDVLARVFVIKDACAGVTTEGTENALKEMEEHGVKIIESSEFLKSSIQKINYILK